MNNKPLNTLVNNIKLANIIAPLIEAIEINKRTEGVPGLTASELLKEVIEAGTFIYEQVAKDGKNNNLPQEAPDLIFITLALCLRNSTVLYNCPNLNMVREEVVRLIQDNSRAIASLNLGNRDSLHNAVSISISHLHMPTILFHSNLYTSGLISLDKMNDLNIQCSERITAIYLDAVKALCISESSIKLNIAHILADSGSKMLSEYHLKIIKSKSALFEYIDSPDSILLKIMNAIQGAWVVLSDVTQESMSELSK